MEYKRLSAAVFYTDRKQFLAVHPTNKNYWDLPKGIIDEGETDKDAAAREFQEEVGLSLDKSKLQRIARFHLHITKDIILYLYVVDELPDIHSFRCKSMTTAYGNAVPEVDDYKYFKLDEVRKMRYELHNILNILMGSLKD